ncbi:phage major capsid protein [Micromonospora sp. NPDC049662]|uniref:phage major capsid protein n=1 Tax=Micromonospora sp. NPDC049662 TaxID=3155397 RepID=UPI003426C9FA
MSTKMYDRLRADLSTLGRETKALTDKATAEGRELTEPEKEQAASLVAQMDGVKTRMEQIRADEKLRKAIGDLGDGGPRFNDGGPGEYVPAGKGSTWARQVAGKLIMQAERHGVKALVSGSIDVPSIVEPVVDLPARPTRILDLIPRRPLTGNTYEYLRQTLRTNNAAVVADNATKPTSIYTVGSVEDRARVIAHLSEAIPERYFADHQELFQLLDREMREDALIALETEITTGDGTGEHFTGIINVSGTLSQAWSTDILTTTRKARTTLENALQQPTAYAMNPTDWETIDLLQDNEGRYYYGGPSSIATPVLHGLPVVVTPAVAAGTAILADWRQARLRVREDMRMDADRSGTLFDKNQVKLRVEGRFAFDLVRPPAFCEIDLTA